MRGRDELRCRHAIFLDNCLECLRAENEAMRATMRNWNEAQERRDATLKEREVLLCRLWRKERPAFAELDALVNDDGSEGLGCVLDELTRGR